MSLYSQNVSNNPLSLDGLITGNFDLLYVDGEPITPTDTSGLVPYIGANATVNLNTQNIKSSFVPLLPEDLTNKQYTDDKYLNKAGFSVSSGGFVFDGTSTLYLHGTTNIVVPAVSPSYSLGIDATGDLIKFTGGTGDAVLSAGTSLSPQIFTGYDKFNNLLKTADIDTTGNITASGLTTTNTLKILTTTTTTPLYSLGILGTGDVVQFTGGTGDAILNAGTLAFPQQFTGYNFFSNLWCGAVRFPFGVASGTPNYILGVDTTTGNLVSTAPTSAPTQLTVLNQSTVAGNYYPVYITNTASGVRPVYSMNGAFYEPITQIWEATNIKSVGTTTCVGTLFTQSGITNMAGQFLITDNLRSPNTGMTFIIPSAIATFGFQNNTTELLKIDSTGITVSRYNSVYDATMIFNTSGPAVPPLPTREMSFRYNNTPFMTASPNSISMNAPLTVNMISSFISSNLALSAPGTNYVSIQGVQFTTADILTLTSQIFYSSKIYAQSGVNLLYNVNTGYNHNFNVNGVNTCFINSAGLVMTGSRSIEGQVLSSPASTALFITGSTDLNLTATSIVYYGCNTLHSFSVNSIDTLLLNTKGAVIPRSRIARSNLTDYELIVGDGVATPNFSGKMLIRGASINSSQAPSVDFTAWYSHTTVQGRLTLYDSNNWGGIMATMVKIEGSGSAGAMANVFELSAPTATIGKMNFKDCNRMDVYCNNTSIVEFARPSSDIPVKIFGGFNQNNSWWYYQGGANWNLTGGFTFSVGLYVQRMVSADGGYLIASDARIKKNIKPVDRGALDKIDTIPITSYEYIDPYSNGANSSFNVIAQDVNEVFPECVSKSNGFIPDMYVKCRWIHASDTEIEINIPNQHTVNIGDKVRCILEDDSQKEAIVSRIIDANTFAVKKWIDFNLDISDEMFVYGKEITDFLRVDKTKLSLLGLAGVKELHQIVKKQEETINTLLDHVKRLTEQVNQITLKMV
jgi:hypothetical protein